MRAKALEILIAKIILVTSNVYKATSYQVPRQFYLRCPTQFVPYAKVEICVRLRLTLALAGASPLPTPSLLDRAE